MLEHPRVGLTSKKPVPIEQARPSRLITELPKQRAPVSTLTDPYLSQDSLRDFSCLARPIQANQSFMNNYEKVLRGKTGRGLPDALPTGSLRMKLALMCPRNY